ncbi:hypothetical protein [Amycolatopsis thermophila]|uniref:hypothetical protein n=1 Tax=Amycolatopsis thermophila TaxID=206084 RepID=UPI003522FDDB
MHLLRNSFRHAGRRHGDAIAKAVRPVYAATRSPSPRNASPSSPKPGAASIRPSRGCVGTPGPSSCRSWPSTRRSGG